MPLVSTAPGHSRISPTAFSKSPSIEPASPRTAEASASRTCWAKKRRSKAINHGTEAQKRKKTFPCLFIVWIIGPPPLKSSLHGISRRTRHLQRADGSAPLSHQARRARHLRHPH